MDAHEVLAGRRVIVVDVETKRLAREVPGGWRNVRAFGLACAVTWDPLHGFRHWDEAGARVLVATLAVHDMVVGFNLIDFDLQVLDGVAPGAAALVGPRALDMLRECEAGLRALGLGRAGLDSIARATLGRGKTGNALDAPRLYRSGRWEALLQYCQDDVALERDLFAHGCLHGSVQVFGGGRLARVAVDWRACLERLPHASGC